VHASTATPLPFGLEPISFPFPALAALAGRLPHGGGREVALAALTCARLASGALGPCAHSPAERAARANGAKLWLASVALPAHTRVPFARCIDATAGSVAAIVAPLRALITAATPNLDGSAVEELERLARRLTVPS
jgi:hypothetical protein